LCNSSLVAAAFLLFISVVHAQSLSHVGEVSAALASSSNSRTTRAISFGWNGLLFSTRDKAYQLRLHGYVQADNWFFSNTAQGEGLDKFLFRRIRPLFEGTVFNAVDFRFMPDFGQNNPHIQEAYVELKSIPVARLRAGKFKEPIGLEVLKSDRQLTFAERSLASDLVPLRYMGAQVGASILSNSITYAVGYFNGTNDGSNGNLQWLPGNEAAARLFVHPFATTGVAVLKQFGIGLAGSAGDQHGTIAGLRTVGQSTFFKYSSTAVANGQHNRISPQAYYYFGPLGLMSEYVISSQDVLNEHTTRRLQNQAWQVAGSVMLTGEKNAYSGISQRRNFEPTKGLRNMGAFELAVRYSQLQVDPRAFPLFANAKTAAQEARERGIALNWYLNRYVKLVADYECTAFRMAAKTRTPLHSENVLMSRIQLAF
jgi:phosphate-selective porin OprO and OprP